MNTSRHAGYTAGWISSSLNSQPYVDILKQKNGSHAIGVSGCTGSGGDFAALTRVVPNEELEPPYVTTKTFYDSG